MEINSKIHYIVNYDPSVLIIGTNIIIGRELLLAGSQIGKVCHNRCNIFYAVGDCVMPREGIFAKVLVGGEIKINDPIAITE